MSKTKRVSGVDLGPDCFAFVVDAEDPATWKLPVYFRGNESLTRQHILNALYRFAGTNIPDAHRSDVWRVIAGAAKAHGIKAGPQPTPALTGKARTETAEPLEVLDAESKEARAVGLLAAERLLKRMGY